MLLLFDDDEVLVLLDDEVELVVLVHSVLDDDEVVNKIIDDEIDDEVQYAEVDEVEELDDEIEVQNELYDEVDELEQMLIDGLDEYDVIQILLDNDIGMQNDEIERIGVLHNVDYVNVKYIVENDETLELVVYDNVELLLLDTKSEV